MPKERITNEEVVGHLMKYSPYGALCQVFIIEAIRKYSEDVANTPTPTSHGGNFISAISWHGIAVDIKKRLEDIYETQKEVK